MSRIRGGETHQTLCSEYWVAEKRNTNFILRSKSSVETSYLFLVGLGQGNVLSLSLFFFKKHFTTLFFLSPTSPPNSSLEFLMMRLSGFFLYRNFLGKEISFFRKQRKWWDKEKTVHQGELSWSGEWQFYVMSGHETPGYMKRIRTSNSTSRGKLLFVHTPNDDLKAARWERSEPPLTICELCDELIPSWILTRWPTL